MNQVAVDYLAGMQCSGQWKDYLSALAAEFVEQLSVDDLRILGNRVGRRFAESAPLPRCHELGEMEAAANQVWSKMTWGGVQMREEADGLSVVHYCSPIVAAFGEAGMAWSPAFLEGVYQAWFVASGAGESLRLTQVADCDRLGTVHFRLGR